MTTHLKPSELSFSLIMPFPGLLQKMELEWAAACVVLAARGSDAWDTWLEWEDVRVAVVADKEGARLIENPIFCPDFLGLLGRGLLETEGGAPYGEARMRPTTALLDLIAQRPAAAPTPEVA